MLAAEVVPVAIVFGEVLPGDVGRVHAAFGATASVGAMAAGAGYRARGQCNRLRAHVRGDSRAGGAGAVDIDLLAALFLGREWGGRDSAGEQQGQRSR